MIQHDEIEARGNSCDGLVAFVRSCEDERREVGSRRKAHVRVRGGACEPLPSSEH